MSGICKYCAKFVEECPPDYDCRGEEE